MRQETGMQFEMEKTPARQVYNLLIGLVAPRLIALVTSTDEQGRLNAAPFSSYNYLCSDPPIVGMGVNNRKGSQWAPKDTATNIRRTGEFVINVVTEDLLEKMNVCATDFPTGVSEVDMAGLTTSPSAMVKVPRIAEAHAAMECKEFTTMEIGRSRIILGRVVAMYVEDRFVDMAGPYIKAEELHSVGRMNGLGNYVKTRNAFVTVSRISYEDWEKGKRY